MRLFLWLRCYAEAWEWRWLPLNRALAVPSINTKNSEFKWQLYIGILACFFLKRE